MESPLRISQLYIFGFWKYNCNIIFRPHTKFPNKTANKFQNKNVPTFPYKFQSKVAKKCLERVAKKYQNKWLNKCQWKNVNKYPKNTVLKSLSKYHVLSTNLCMKKFAGEEVMEEDKEVTEAAMEAMEVAMDTMDSMHINCTKA